MLLRKEKASFTLIELIVAAVILGIGAAFLSGVIVTGKVLLKQAQNKAAAMSLATFHLDRFTAMSYEGLNNVPLPSLTGHNTASHGKVLNWDVAITARNMGNAASIRIVPYQEIVANVTYIEDTLMQGVVEKRVSVTGFIPYSFEHIDVYEINDNTGGAVTENWSCVNEPVNCSVDPNDGSAGIFSLSVNVRYRTNKVIILGYNIALDIARNPFSPVPETVTDTILTRGYVRNRDTGVITLFPIVTETPIMSQPVINNRGLITEIDPLSPPARRTMVLQRGIPYRIRVEWRKSTPAWIVRVSRANIIVEAIAE